MEKCDVGVGMLQKLDSADGSFGWLDHPIEMRVRGPGWGRVCRTIEEERIEGLVDGG